VAHGGKPTLPIVSLQQNGSGPLSLDAKVSRLMQKSAPNSTFAAKPNARIPSYHCIPGYQISSLIALSDSRDIEIASLLNLS